MADRALSAGIDIRLAAGIGLIAVTVATAIAAVLGDPVVVLVTSYAVAFVAAIILFGDDAFSHAVNAVIAVYAAAIVFVCTLSPLPGAGIQGLPQTDRLNYYYVYYIGTGLAGTEENIEAGYLLLNSLARAIMPFELFLALVALGVFIALLKLLKAAGQVRLTGIVALTLLAYFSFWSGALNITRQFVAAGIGFSAIVILIREGEMSAKLRVLLFLAFVGVAFSIHSSSFIFGLFGIAYAIRRYGDALLLVIWTGNIVFFALNFIGYSPFGLIPGLSDRLARYDSSQISDASLAQFQNAGVTTGNRLDWAMALLLPMLGYAVHRLARRGKDTKTANGPFLLGLLYTVLCVPFYLLSFLTFGDRIAFYAFLIMPALLTALLADLSKELRYLALSLVAGGCILQVALGLYGYTPKLWLTGEP